MNDASEGKVPLRLPQKLNELEEREIVFKSYSRLEVIFFQSSIDLDIHDKRQKQIE